MLSLIQEKSLIIKQGVIAMNKDIFEGNWEHLKGELRQFWGKLTDNDLEEIKGNQEEIFGKLQKHYGYTKEEAEKEIKNFRNSKRS
jgi:uncharacterized protein YjbJ (UPF0337 family)